MKHLLDVNILLAAIIDSHAHHDRAVAWLKEKQIVLCPLSELGYLRVASHKKAYGLPMGTVRKALDEFARERKASRIPDDLPALDSLHPRTAEDVTDHYLADLAAKHGLKLATLDEHIEHPSVQLVR